MAESGFLDSLNEQQRAALDELGEKTKDIEYIKNHPDGDAYLLRFLRATMEGKKSDRIFHVENWGKNEGALERIKKAAEFYSKYNLAEKPEKYDEFISSIKPRTVWKDKNANAVVTTEKAAKFFNNTKPDIYTEDEWKQLMGYSMEELETQIREFRNDNNLDDRPCLIAIQDASGLGLGVRSMKTVFTWQNEVGGMYHPEVVKKIYVVNAPWIFEKIFAVIKQFLDPRTAEKVEVVQNPGKTLPEKFDVELLPTEFGGKGENLKIPFYARNAKEEEVTEEQVQKLLE